MHATPFTHKNALGQPIGAALPNWQPATHPVGLGVRTGQWCCLEPLSAQQHGAGLYRAFADDSDHRMWTYMAAGPFPDPDALIAYMQQLEVQQHEVFFCIIEPIKRQPMGWCSYMRIKPAVGVLELGHLAFAPAMQRTRIATEAVYMMLKTAFEVLGYRRVEWKCDNLNSKSKAAAKRFGFEYEGTFKQATIYKGRTRDTCWFGMTDAHWANIQACYQAWLAPDNFDAQGQQKQRLTDMMACMPSGNAGEEEEM
jgi:RimJ/RimL family protein N-acetyltransferase